MANHRNLDGTMRSQFSIGKNDTIDFRTDVGEAQYRDNGGLWTPFHEAEQLILFSRKGSPGTINKGEAVYISGWNPSGFLEVELAQANSASTMPAIGLAHDSITNSALSRVLHAGTLEGIAVSAAVGAPLYVSPTVAGGLTSRPTGATNLVQKICQVLRQHPSAGAVEVFGAGRTNDVPNIQQNYYWVGDATGVATAVPVPGSDSAYAISLSESTTTDDVNWTQKVRMQLTPLSVGNYEINFSCLMSAQDGNRVIGFRLQLDDTTDLYLPAASFPQKFSDGLYAPFSGTVILESLSASTHNIDLDFRSYDSGKTVYIKNATITGRRIGI